jgi:peroxiredoxin Q/BCP
VVLGISRDSATSHQKFKEKFEIPFVLLSDPDGKVCGLFGVLKEKNLYGKKSVGIERSTFIIDEKGMIAGVYRGVKVNGHIRELLDALTTAC